MDECSARNFGDADASPGLGRHIGGQCRLGKVHAQDFVQQGDGLVVPVDDLDDLGEVIGEGVVTWGLKPHRLGGGFALLVELGVVVVEPGQGPHRQRIAGVVYVLGGGMLHALFMDELLVIVDVDHAGHRAFQLAVIEGILVGMG